jgi:hypothetical protein
LLPFRDDIENFCPLLLTLATNLAYDKSRKILIFSSLLNLCIMGKLSSDLTLLVSIDNL